CPCRCDTGRARRYRTPSIGSNRSAPVVVTSDSMGETDVNPSTSSRLAALGVGGAGTTSCIREPPDVSKPTKFIRGFEPNLYTALLRRTGIPRELGSTKLLAHSAARAACQSGDRRIVELKRLGACSVCLGHISARRPRYREQAAPRDRWRASRGTFALLIRRQTRLSRGVKQILVTGITVTTLLASAATASAQNIFEALFGRRAPSPAPIVPAANFTARDRQQLANPPYRQASIPPAYRRQIVRYHRKEAPGTVLVD